MILCIANVLDSDALAAIRAGLQGGSFLDGAASAGWSARLVKVTQQLADGPVTRALQARVTDALRANSVFANAALPHRIASPNFLRYGTGMAYGTHVDNAIMGTGAERLRTDVSVTVFLSAPDEYDGGELVIESAAGEESYKLAPGAALAYPSNTLHRVNEVTRGTRDVAVTWVQCLVRSAEQREVLFDIERVRRSMFERDGKTPEFDLLHKTASNLRRMWADV
jgi:PKHD-type hydroxylase